MGKRRGCVRDEERYWRIRIVLEFARVAAEVVWDVIRRGGAASLFSRSPGGLAGCWPGARGVSAAGR